MTWGRTGSVEGGRKVNATGAHETGYQLSSNKTRDVSFGCRKPTKSILENIFPISMYCIASLGTLIRS